MLWPIGLSTLPNHQKNIKHNSKHLNELKDNVTEAKQRVSEKTRELYSATQKAAETEQMIPNAERKANEEQNNLIRADERLSNTIDQLDKFQEQMTKDDLDSFLSEVKDLYDKLSRVVSASQSMHEATHSYLTINRKNDEEKRLGSATNETISELRAATKRMDEASSQQVFSMARMHGASVEVQTRLSHRSAELVNEFVLAINAKITSTTSVVYAVWEFDRLRDRMDVENLELAEAKAALVEAESNLSEAQHALVGVGH